MVPDILAPQIAAGFGKYLLGCAKNLGKALGFDIRRRAPRDTAEAASLIDEMRTKSRHGIRVFQQDDGTVRITHGIAVEQSWDTYFIPVRPTEYYRPALKELTQRFLKTIETEFKIGDLSDQPNFDYILEMQADMKEEAKDRPEVFCEDEIEQLRSGDPYRYDGDDGYAINALRDIWKKEPLTRKDIESFRFRGKAELKLRDAMLSLMEVVEAHFDIWNYSSFANPFTGEIEADRLEGFSDGFIPFNSICTIVYDFDPFLEEYTEMLNNDANAGYDTEYLVGTEELTPDSAVRDMNLPKRFISSLEAFINAMDTEELRPKQKKQKTKDNA